MTQSLVDSAALTVLDDVVSRARKAGADAADAVMVDGRSVSVGWRLGELESLERSEGADLGLRVFIGKRQAIVSSADQSPRALDELVERAVAMAKTVPEDDFAGLADPDQLATDLPKLDGFDPTELTADQMIEMVKEAEDTARQNPAVTNSEGAQAGWSSSSVAVVGTNGMNFSWRVSNTSLSCVVLAGGGEQGMERDYEYDTTNYVDALKSPAEIGRKAAERAARRLGARRVKSARVPVIYDPRVARGLIGHLLGAINGSSIARGTSFLKDKMNQPVMAPGITIVEDPHRPRGLRSKPCDAEGLPNQRRNIVDGGTLTTWLLDLRSARQLGLAPTGHASRGTGSPPSPSATNVWIEAGEMSAEDMLAGVKEGVYVTDLFGHGINGVTGDYSRGLAGFWIEDGKLAFPINEMTVAGNLKDMFMNMTAASDLEMRFGMDAPTVRIDGMTVAGA
ncbi:TldE/PmbA protein [Caenispirillum salinarum AK4]|uniref:TldE/PmbA protein n=1 Tax=Caenispirillum salinarum AK4 TaxID=1238182 RepID=K9HWA0_9PROT|nr:TldD/PmbA family protein [Caenispirillum salinarum]EKV32506.1 TldE/PmbA protein [Caenispirillum salinarum AK4]